MLASVRVGACQQDSVPGVLGECRPDLLALDAPAVSLADGLGAQRGQVAAASRFAEELAPDVVGAEESADVALFLLFAAVGQDGRSAHTKTDVAHRAGHPGAVQLFIDDGLLGIGSVSAAVLARPGESD